MDSPARALPHRFNRPGGISFVGYVIVVLVILWSLEGAGWSLDRLLSSPPKLADFFSRAWPPSTHNLDGLAWKMVETLQIAVAGAAIGIVLSLPIALLAARGVLAGRGVNLVVRVILGFIRAVPDLAWALVFVVAVGLGPFAGMLAIAIDTIGFCGRFFADDMENTDPGPAEALTATGARRIDIAASAVIPAAFPPLCRRRFSGWKRPCAPRPSSALSARAGSGSS